MMSVGNILRVPPDEVLQAVQAAYDRGQILEALRQAEAFAPIGLWGGVPAGALAARLANQVGAPRLARKLAVRMWRAEPAHPLAQFEYGLQYLQQRGPLRLWLQFAKWPNPVAGRVQWPADLLALKSWVACDLRDFDAAEKFLSGAEALDSSIPWVRLQRAHLLEKLDQVEEALAVTEAAIKLHPYPYYRAGIQSRAHLLQLLDRDEAAINLLQRAVEVLQSGPIVAQLYGILAENERWPEAADTLEKYVQLSPLLEKPFQIWVTSQRARTAYYLGRRADAVRYAREANDEFNLAFAQKLEEPVPAVERVRLDVPFVRQHFKTCAPATQAALGKFWRLPADHLQLVEAVCYDGTPRWKQRDWSEQNGWLVQEFRVTWESAVALLSRGIPFAISTVEATSAHMQAVMGFDLTRQALYLRDPHQPYALEWPVDRFFKR